MYLLDVEQRTLFISDRSRSEESNLVGSLLLRLHVFINVVSSTSTSSALVIHMYPVEVEQRSLFMTGADLRRVSDLVSLLEQ